MESVVLRIVTGGRLETAVAAFQIERTDDYVVLAIPVGSAGFTRDGVRGGPRGTFLLPDGWEPGYRPRPWRDRDLVMVHRFSDEWSTWRWLDESNSWVPGAYVNLERLWTIGPGSYETDDLTLDVLLDERGETSLKDEDELAWAEGEGIYTATEAAHIRRVGEDARRHFTAGGWPSGVDWNRWRWPASAGVPQLPIDGDLIR